MARDFSTKLLDMIDDGLLDKDTVIMACVKYMSEDDVRDMMFANDFVEDTDDWDEDEEPDVDEAQEWHDFDPDC
jgi:hypothetical protein